MVPEIWNKRQIAISDASRPEMFVEMLVLGWLRSLMRPVLVAISVRLATVAAIRSWKRVLVRPMKRGLANAELHQPCQPMLGYLTQLAIFVARFGQVTIGVDLLRLTGVSCEVRPTIDIEHDARCVGRGRPKPGRERRRLCLFGKPHPAQRRRLAHQRVYLLFELGAARSRDYAGLDENRE